MTAFVAMILLSSFLLAVSATASASHAAGTDICYKYDVNGCSIPFHMYFFYKKRFTPSCNRHDICYSCGVAYNITRVKCDDAFLGDMNNACRSDYLHLSLDKEIPPSEDDIRVLLYKKSVLSILDKHAMKFKQVLWKKIPEYKNLWNKLDKYEDTSAFTQMYTDHVVTQWARLLARYLQMTCESVQQQSRQLSHFRPSIKQWQAVSMSASEINDSTKNMHFNPFLLNPVQKETTPHKRNSAVGAILECNRGNTSFCENIRNNLPSGSSFYDLTVELQCADINLLQCNLVSEVYYYAVHFFGSSRFRHHPEFYCNESFVQECLPPHEY